MKLRPVFNIRFYHFHSKITIRYKILADLEQVIQIDEKAFNSNFGFQKIEILNNNIGYLKLSEINISGESLKTLYAAMEFVKNTKALIIDLRDNSGGGSTVGAVFESFFFTRETELLEFKSRNGTSELKKTEPWLLEKKYTKPLHILINGKTASAAEAITFALKY